MRAVRPLGQARSGGSGRENQLVSFLANTVEVHRGSTGLSARVIVSHLLSGGFAVASDLR
jgi:hypothetical protein